MKKTFLLNRIKTVRKDLFYLFWLSIIFVFMMDMWLINIPEWFPKASVIGNIFYKISFAYITAFLFYFLNVHMQGHKNKVKTLRYVSNKVHKLRSMGIDLIISIREAGGQKNEDYEVPTEEELKELCKHINPQLPVKFASDIPRFSNWFELFRFLDQETGELVKDLLLVRDTLDAEFLRILTNLDSCAESHLNTFKGYKLANDDLTAWVFGIHQYRSLCKELSEYLSKNYELHMDEYHHLERMERKIKEMKK